MQQLNDQTGTIYQPAQAVFEATRCIECYSAPCVDACPVGVDIPRFIGRIKMGDFIGADQIIREKCLLPGVCGLICPVERLCVQSCCVTEPLGPVRIHQLQRFAAAYAIEHNNKESTSIPSSRQKVGIIGSGPSGLAVASALMNKGYRVTVFEAMDSPGGMMTYSIPDHRLPRNILEAEIDAIKKRGIEIRTGTRVDPGELLEQGFSAVFLGIGTHKPVSTGIPGSDLTGVYQGLDFLRLVSDGSAAAPFGEEITGRRVAVVGGGDVAMDAAISAARLGAKRIHLLYRRSYQEMPAIESEVSLAQQEGVLFWILTNPTRIIGDEQGRVRAVECLEMELGEPDDSGRRRPLPVAGSEFQLDIDILIEAVGQRVDSELIAQLGVETDSDGTIQVGEYGETSRAGLFAAGDVISGGTTVVQALAEGARAAEGIDRYLSS